LPSAPNGVDSVGGGGGVTASPFSGGTGENSPSPLRAAAATRLVINTEPQILKFRVQES